MGDLEIKGDSLDHEANVSQDFVSVWEGAASNRESQQKSLPYPLESLHKSLRNSYLERK